MTLPAPLWLITAIFGIVLGLYGGYRYAQVEKLEAVERAIEQANEIAKQDQEVFNASAEMRTKIRIKYRTITRDADGVKAGGCVDLGADYFGLYNRAISAATY